MAKMLNCKWCAEGREPNEMGEHWIVTSIIPARIKIVKCKYEVRSAYTDAPETQGKNGTKRRGESPRAG